MDEQRPRIGSGVIAVAAVFLWLGAWAPPASGQSLMDQLTADLVKLRYYAGLTIPQAAEALGISSTTADRYWAYARAWLHSELKKGARDTVG